MTHRVKLTWKTAAAVAGFLLIAVMFVMPRSVRAEEQGTVDDTYTWVYDDGDLLIDSMYEGDFISKAAVDKIVESVATATGIDFFYDMNVTLGENISIIVEGAFEGKPIYSITFEGDVNVQNKSFKGCDHLESAAFKNDVYSIGDSAFENCNNLINVSFSSNLYSIGESAFKACSKLEGFVFPSTLSSIGNESFYRCTGLTSIKVDNTDLDFARAFHSSSTGSDGMSFVYAGSQAHAKDKGLRYICEKAGDNATYAKVRITFDPNTGDTPTYEEKDMGSTFDRPDDPVKEGYVLSSWLAGDEYGHYYDTYTFGTVTTSDVYLLANWVADETTVLAGYSLSLEGDIGVNFYVRFASSVPDSTKVTLTNAVPSGRKANTASYTVGTPSGTATVSGVTYKIFKLNVAPSTMTCPITITAGNDVLGDDFTVKDYAEVILKNEGNNAEYAAKEDLVKAMLNYGAYSQKHFDVNTDDLANDIDGIASFDNVPGTTVPDMTIDEISTTTDPIPEDWPVEYYGSGLDLKDKVTAYVYFKVPEDFDMDSYFLKLNGQTGDFVTRNNDYFICFKKEFTASELSYMGQASAGCPCTITIEEKGGAGAHYAYYPGLYSSAVCNSEGEEITDSLKNLSKALYLYAVACGS